MLNVYSGWWVQLQVASSTDMPLKLKERFQINIVGLEIPTGGRQTSWLFTNMTEELNYKQGTTPAKRSERDLTLRSPDLKSSALTTLSHCLPVISYQCYQPKVKAETDNT